MKDSKQRRFWHARLVFVVLNAPVIAFLQWRYPDVLVPYLVWMSWLTWVSAELPTKPDGD